MAIKPQDMIQIAKSVQSKQQKPKSLEERVRERAREARKTNLLDQAQLNTFEQDSKDYEQRLSRLQQRYDNDEYVDPNEVKDILNRGKALETRATAYETYLKDYAPDQKDALYTASKIRNNYANQLNGLDGVQKFYGQFENADAFNTYAANKKREDYLINEYDLAKGKDAVDAAEQEMNRLASTHGNALKNPIYRATVGKVFGNEAIDDYTAAKDRYDDLVAEYNQAQKLQQLASYDDVKKNSDFASKSVAGDDLLSKFINMDEKDRKSADVWTSILGGITEGRGVIGSIADAVGLQNSELNDLVDKYHSMTDDEKKVFNYINNTQGAVAARQYLYDIGEGLSLRAAGQQKKKLDKILPDNWAGDAAGGLLAFDNAINSGVSNAFSSFGEGIYQAVAQNDKVQNTSVSANRLGLDREEANAVGKVLLDLAQSTGNMIPSVVLSSVTGVPILGAGMMGVQAKGSAYNQAIKDGMTPQQAQAYSTAMGALEGGLSYALTGIGKGATKLIKPLGTAIDGISNGFLRALASFGVEAAGEALEEGLTEIFDPLVKNLVTGSGESVNWNDVGYSALLGFLSGGLLEGTPASIRAYSLPDATAESFKTHYDTGDGFEDFSNNVFKDDTLLSLQVIELVKDGKPEEAVSALNKGLRNYRYAKEYAKQKYGVKSASEIDKRIQTIETLKASIKAGKFNAQSAATALRNSSDVWQIAAQNNDTVVQALLDGDLTNSKIENKILNDRGTKIAFRRKTGVDLDQLPTVSKKRQAARATSQVYKAFVNTDAYRNMQKKTKANETESDAAVRVQNKRSIIDGMLALGNQSLNEAKEARKNGDVALAEEKETMARLANTAIQNTRKNTGSTYFATNDAVGVVIFDELKGLGEKYLSGLDEADRRYLTDVRSIKALSDAERSVKERLNNQREAATKKREKSLIDRQIDAVDAYYASAVMAFQNARDAMDADFSNVVDERIKTMNKRLGRYGITVEGFSNGLRYLDANGNEISYQEAMRRQQSGEQVSATMLRGMQSARTIQIARDVAKGVVPVMNPVTGKIEQLRIGNGPGMISAERAVDVILGHEAVHYAMKYGKGDLVNQVLNHVAGTKIDTEYEIDNRRNNKPVSKEAEERWNRLKDTYAKEVAKEKNISVEEALKQVDDRYLYEEIACDYVGSVAAYQDFANLLASQNRNLFMRIVESIRNLVNALRNGGKNHSAKAAEDLSKRLASIADKHYGKYEKTIKNDTAQNVAESPVGDDTARVDGNEAAGKNEERGEKEEAVGEIVEDGVTENAEGEPVAMENGDGSTRMSLVTWEEDGRDALGRYLENHISEDDLSQEDVDDIMSSMDEIYAICRGYEDQYETFGAWSRAKVERDRNGDPVFSVVKSNGDYAMNLDFSLVCKKRRALDAVFNRLIEMGKINTFDFGQTEIVKINEIIRKHGFEVACALCFVDAKRYRQAKVADDFVTMYNNLVKSLDGNKVGIDYFNFGADQSLVPVQNGIDALSDKELDFTKIDKVLNGGKSKTVIYKIAQHLKENPQDRKLLSRGDFMSSYGFGEVKKNNPEILSLYNSKKGSGGPKASFGDVQYLNEILEQNKFNAEDAYDVGGVRIQSFSDYVARLVFDYAQMVADLSAKKLPAHAYTKEVLFVKQFGLTGIKINMSLIPSIGNGEYAGLNADGSYAWASESFPVDEAIAIQSDPEYGRNCGTIAVGVSDEHIRKLMSDPNIRMVIPYHRSGINPVVAHMMNIKGFTDYTKQQNTAYGDGKKLSAKDMEGVPDFNQMMHRDGLDAIEASRRYVEWCEERGYLPKFAKFAYETVNGKRMFNENYYKLLEDFTTMVDGEFHPQEEVRPIYPDENSAFGSMKELIRQGLEEDAVTAGNILADTDNMVKEISEVLAEGENKMSVVGKFSLDADLDALEEAQRMYQNGDSRDKVVKKTGWWLGKDGKWRYEISDEDMDFDRNGFVKNPKTVGDYVKHDKLFQAYPQLKDVRVAFVDKVGDSVTAKGRFESNRNTIEIRRSLDAYEAKKVMLHELQHVIQRIEGFKRGSSKKTGGMLVFNEIYRRVKNYPRFQDLKSKSDKFNYVKSMADIEGGSPFDLLARDAYLNDHGELEAQKTVERMNLSQEKLRSEPYFNDGIIVDRDKVQKKFVDNLIAIGYNEKKANQIAKEGLRYDYQYEDGAELDVEGNFGHEGEGAGSRRSPLAGDYDGKTGRQRQVYGAGEISGPDAVARKVGMRIERSRVNQEPSWRYSVSGEFDADYLSAVETGDVKTAQKMVDEAARSAGYNSPKLYHGTEQKGFTKIKTTGVEEGHEWSPFFATDSIETAGTYSGTEQITSINEPVNEDDLFDAKWDALDDAESYAYHKMIKAEHLDEWSISRDDIHSVAFEYAEKLRYGYISSDDVWSSLYEELTDMVAFAYMENNEYMDFAEWQESPEGFEIGEALENITSKAISFATFQSENAGNYSFYANTDYMLEVDGEGSLWSNIKSEYGRNTRAIAKTAYEKGYSGVIIKNIVDEGKYGGGRKPSNVYIFFYPESQVKSADPVTYDDNGNVIPLSERFNPENVDIRFSSSGEFSLDDGAESYDKLKRQIAEQKEKIHRLTMEMAESHGSHLDVKETGRFLHELLDRYGATLTVKGVERDFNDITEYLYRQYEIERDDQGNFLSKKKVKSVDADKLQGMIQRLASRIMESAVDVDAQYDSYVAFLKTVHDTTIGITPEIKEAFGDGWNRFRQSNFGRMNLRNAETSDLDAFYHELADQYPEILDETVTEPAEQLKAIAEAAKTIRETGLDPKNIYGVDGESVVADIAYDISEGIATIDRAMNFADKAKQRVADQRLADDVYYGKKIASIRNRYEAKMDAMAEHFATKVKNRSEAQQARYQKKMVEKRCLDLAKRLAKPTKDKHVPEEMVADVYRLLKQIQLPLKNKADADTNLKISQFLETVQKRYGDEKLKPSDGVGFPEALKKDIEAFAYRSMDEMTAQQLHGLNELVRRAQFAISNFDKAFHSGEKISVESLKAFDHFRDSRGTKGKFGLGHTIVDFVMNYVEDPEAFFSILDVPELTEAYHRIADGQNKLAQNVKKLTNDLSDIVGENGVPKSWREQATPYTVSTGVTLRMTPAQLMTLYLYSKQTDSYKCLINDNGGIAVAATNHKTRLTDKNGRVVETNNFKKLKNLKDVRHIEPGSREIGNMTSLNQAMLDELLGHLTDEQRAMADKISAHLNTTVADMANETSLETEGYRKYVTENYFPMAVFDRNKSVDEVFRDMHGQIMTEGFTKERSGLSGKKLIVDDVFSVVNRHDVAVAQYNAYKKALLDYRKLLTIRPNGESSLESQIVNYFGVGNKNRVNDFLNNFVLDVQGVQMATGEETLLSEKFLRNYKAAQVAANLSVVVKQPTSIIRALPEFSADAIKVMVKPVDPKTAKADIAEMQEHSGLAFFKANGYSEYANARGFEELYNKNAFTLRDNFDNAMSWGAEQMDLLTWSAIWRAAKADTNTIEEATDKFNEVIRKTQVVDTALTSSRVTRQNGLFKMAFAFKNEPLKNINYIRTTLNDYAVGKEGSGQKLAKVLAASGINTLINAAITAAVSMLRDDEKGTIEEFFDKTSDNFLYGVASDTLVFAGDVWEAIEAAMSGKTVERMDLAAITDIVEIMIDAFEYFGKPESERKETPLKIWHNLSKAISNLTGIPISNFSRFQHTLGSLVGSVFNDPWLDYLLASRYYNADGFDNTQVKKKFRSILTDALNNGDYEGYARVKNELLSKGFSTSEIEKAIAKSDVFYKAFNKGPEAFRAEVNAAQKYDPTISSTSVMSAIKSRKTGLVSDLYDAAKAGDKKAVQTVRDELLQLRDVDTKRLLTDKDIDRLLQEKYEKQLKSDVKERLVDLYGTEVYETIKRVILSEYRKFGVTSEEIDRIARSLR